MKNKKILIYSAVGAIGSVAIYYIYNYFRLQSIYSKQATLSEAQIDIQNPQVPIIELPDSDLQDAINKASNGDEGEYSNTDGLDDTATINGIQYTLEDNGTYTSTDGSYVVFNPIDNSLTNNNGDVTIIDPTIVVYTNTGNP